MKKKRKGTPPWERWSPSKLDTLIMCPFMFYLSYVEKLRVPRHIYTVVGQMIHYMLRLFYNPRLKQGYKTVNSFLNTWKGFYWSAKAGKKIFGRNWEKVDEKYTKEDWAKYYKIGAMILVNFFLHWIDQLREPGYVRPIVERRFTAKLGGIQVVGRIDRIELLDEGSITIDYKSGKSVPGKEQLSRDIAFTTYSWLYKNNLSSFDYRPLTGLKLYPLRPWNNKDLYWSERDIKKELEVEPEEKLGLMAIISFLEEKKDRGEIKPLTTDQLIDVPLRNEGHYVWLEQLLKEAYLYVKGVMNKGSLTRDPGFRYFSYGDVRQGVFTPQPGSHCDFLCDPGYQKRCGEFIEAQKDSEKGKAFVEMLERRMAVRESEQLLLHI